MPEHDIISRAAAGLLNQQTSIVAQLGAAANVAAAQQLFAEERMKRARRTIARHDDDLDCFARFIRTAAGLPDPEPGPDGRRPPNPLATSAEAWGGVTWGLIKAFGAWMIGEGYSMSSINGRLATARLYALWASQAGIISPEDMLLINGVQGYDRKAAHNIDEQREVTRVGDKRAEFRVISADEARLLKRQPATPQGRRDAVLINLLIDHGLRCGELALMRVEMFDLKRGTMTFYRPKVYRMQTHNLTPATKRALLAYLREDAIMAGPLLLSSRKGGALTHQGMTERAITQRVAQLAKLAGIVGGLSAHDLRHSWATFAARSGTPLDRLQDAGGWNSPAMPLRYIEAAKIANEGVLLDLDD